MAGPSIYAWHIIACLTADPSSCTEMEPLVPGFTEVNCAYMGMPAALQWLKDNEPLYGHITRIDCRNRRYQPKQVAAPAPQPE